MPADILIYAVVAAGLVIWLRNILGTRHGEERERPNPYTASGTPAGDTLEGLRRAASPSAPEEGDASRLLLPAGGPFAVSGRVAEDGLASISRVDRAFDLTHFLEGAREAFVMIVEAFAHGDLETLKGLLGGQVYGAFESAIQGRESRGETMATEIHAVRRVEILDARVLERMAYITVRFTADETSVVKDGDGNILSGDPERVTEMVDVWIFAREMRSRDPRWLLVETRDDAGHEGEQGFLPDAGGA